jgi:hypothetical protein
MHQDGYKVARNRLTQYVEQACRESGPSDGLKALAGRPIGYRYCWSIWCSDADITNGGLSQYYLNSTHEMVLDAIAGYERIRAHRMADILKSSLLVCAETHPERLRIEVPEDRFKGFVPLAESLNELSDMYCAEKKTLPGNAEGTAVYLDCVVDHWFQTYPTDFR